MLRKDKEITERSLIDAIIKKSEVCRLGLAKDNTPYIVPVSFGYDGAAVYFHTAKEGKKIDYFNSNNSVCFEFESDLKLITDETAACKWSFSFKSVIGYGKVEELVRPEEKKYGLNQIMLHYSGKEWEFNPASLSNTRLWKIDIDSLTGKASTEKSD